MDHLQSLICRHDVASVRIVTADQLRYIALYEEISTLSGSRTTMRLRLMGSKSSLKQSSTSSIGVSAFLSVKPTLSHILLMPVGRTPQRLRPRIVFRRGSSQPMT